MAFSGTEEWLDGIFGYWGMVGWVSLVPMNGWMVFLDTWEWLDGFFWYRVMVGR